MDGQIGAMLILAANCCLMPLIFTGIGFALAKGALRSPVDMGKIKDRESGYLD